MLLRSYGNKVMLKYEPRVLLYVNNCFKTWTNVEFFSLNKLRLLKGLASFIPQQTTLISL